MNKTAAKFAVVAASVAAVVGLVLLALPALTPFLPQQAVVALSGTITTHPGTVDELLDLASADTEVKYSHADVDSEYQEAAAIWPWALPEGYAFTQARGATDTPGYHYPGMGIKAAFAKYAYETIETVKTGDLTDSDANYLLDQLSQATTTLLDAGIITDRNFVATSIDPLIR